MTQSIYPGQRKARVLAPPQPLREPYTLSRVDAAYAAGLGGFALAAIARHPLGGLPALSTGLVLANPAWSGGGHGSTWPPYNWGDKRRALAGALCGSASMTMMTLWGRPPWLRVGAGMAPIVGVTVAQWMYYLSSICVPGAWP